MDKKEMNMLRKQYPAQYYSIIETNGKLVVKQRTAILWFPSRFLKEIIALSPEQLSTYIENLIEKSDLTPEYFDATQKVITLQCAEKIAYIRKEMRCRKTELVAALFRQEAIKK